jgi:hypothetical protein
VTQRYTKLIEAALDGADTRWRVIVTQERRKNMDVGIVKFQNGSWVSISYHEELGECVSFVERDGMPEDSFDSVEWPELDLDRIFIKLVRKYAAR